MDAGREQDTRLDGEAERDTYLLRFRPAPLAPDVVVRPHSAAAKYCHDFARKLPPAPSAGLTSRTNRP